MVFKPKLFRRVREVYGISHQEIQESVRPELNRSQIFKSNEMTSGGQSSNIGGRSNRFFFFT